MPSWRSGKTHRFCVTGGHRPIASEPTPSPRLWAPRQARPQRSCANIPRGLQPNPQKPELSTWLRTGSFYLAPTGRMHKNGHCEGKLNPVSVDKNLIINEITANFREVPRPDRYAPKDFIPYGESEDLAYLEGKTWLELSNDPASLRRHGEQFYYIKQEAVLYLFPGYML